MKYKVKIMCFLLCLIVMLVSVLMVVFLNRVSLILEDEYTAQAELELNVVYSAFDKLTSTVTQTYVPIVYDNLLKDYLLKEYSTVNATDIRRILDVTPIRADYITSLAVYSMQGDYLVGTSAVLTNGNLTDKTKKIFTNLKKNQLERVWFLSSERYFLGEESVNKCLSFCVPIYSRSSTIADQHPIGFLIINIRLDYINNLLKQSTMNKNLDVYILNKYGSLLTNTDYFGEQDVEYLDYKFAKEVKPNETYKIGTEEYIICKLESSYDNQFFYLSLMPTSRIQSRLWEVTETIIKFGIIILLLSLPVSLLIFRSIYKPVGIMIKYMGELADSTNFDVQISETRSDEFGLMFREFNKMTTQIKNLVQQLYINKLLLKESQLLSLQSQINPHLLYNTMNTISCLAIQKRNDDVAEIVANLSDFMRLSLNDGLPMISVRKTINQIINYISIQSVRFPDRIVFTHDVDDSLLENELPTLLIQPLVENSVIHGIPEEGIVSIHLQIKLTANNHISIYLEDDGNGIPYDKLSQIKAELNKSNFSSEESSFYALRNIHNRIKLTYSESYGLDINSTIGHGVTCKIIIPQKHVQGDE